MIYQYTNINALALILKNRTIRFNRLDMVDDIEEGQIESSGIKFCKYVFVSCWTESAEENIPLWKMYGGDFGGVRIGLDKEMFKKYMISRTDLQETKGYGAFPSLIPPKDWINPNYSFYPLDSASFYRHIQYVDDVEEITKDAVKFFNVTETGGEFLLRLNAFGTYKHRRWAFQEESRFVLYAFPFNLIKDGQNATFPTKLVQSLVEGKPLPFTYYDLSLKDDAFDNIEIRLSPSVTDSQRIIIQSLVDKYAPHARIVDSSLGKLVRLK